MISRGRRWLLGVSLTMLLAPGGALAAPGDLVVVHGTVAERHDNLLVIRGDNGRTYYTDLTAVNKAALAGLKPGDPAFIRGTEGTYPNEVRATAVELDTARALRPPAPGQTAAPGVFEYRDWRLPAAHRYERHDPATSTYTPVDILSVPARVERGEWIYDRTAGRWVNHPSTGRNPVYLAYTPGVGVPGSDADRLVHGSWRLPRSHRYESYDPATGIATPVDVLGVAPRIERGEWIYDRTAGQWVNHPNTGRNSAYLAGGAPVAAVTAAAEPDTLAHGAWYFPRSHRYETYDPDSGRYAQVDVASLPARVERGEWIYDRTAGQWVSHRGMKINEAYLEGRAYGVVESVAGRTLTVRMPDGRLLTVDTSRVVQPAPPFAAGDRIVLTGDYEAPGTFIARSAQRAGPPSNRHPHTDGR